MNAQTFENKSPRNILHNVTISDTWNIEFNFSLGLKSVFQLFNEITIKGDLKLNTPNWREPNEQPYSFTRSFKKIILSTDSDKSPFYSKSGGTNASRYDRLAPGESSKINALIETIFDLVMSYNATLIIEGENVPENGIELDSQIIRSLLQKESKDFNLNEIDSTKSSVSFIEHGEIKTSGISGSIGIYSGPIRQ